MVLAWVSFGVALAVIAVLLGLRATHGPARPAGGASAEEALKRRYARGEIDAAEYRRRLEELRR